MHTPVNFQDRVAAANQALSRPAQHRVIGAASPESPRFEVYHGAPSLCSHKVRTVLAEKRVPYLSHDISLFAGKKAPTDNYRPAYVRLRLQAAPEGASLANGYTGRSSVATEGFDPCVVPTLVDHKRECVVADSAEICRYLDREAESGLRLVPGNLETAIDGQIDQVDRAPHVAVLYGAHPEEDRRPGTLAAGIKGVHDRKIKSLRAMLETVRDEPELVRAYEAKIEKESNGRAFIYTADRMLSAHAAIADHVQALERQLGTHDGDWVMGGDYTLADIMWTASLFRLKWLGLGHLWEGNASAPRVGGYLPRAVQRPSFQQAVVRWPLAYGPSKHVKETGGLISTLKFAWAMMRMSR